MHERLKASEVGQIECQTCEKKIYVVKKILGNFFLKFFSLNLFLIYFLNYFYHFQPFLYYKKCAYLKEVIRRDFDQCVYPVTYFLLLFESFECLPVFHRPKSITKFYFLFNVDTQHLKIENLIF